MQTVVSKLREPVCILGGWAVSLRVGENFRREHGRDYLGSRDIDLGFHIKKDWSLVELKGSDLAFAIDTLNEMGFEPLSFRFMKHFHTETLQELNEDNVKKTPAYNVFDLFIDPVVDCIHPKFGEIFGFAPIDEPLLEHVFVGQKRSIMELFGRRVLVPFSEVLLATKLRSVVHRDKEHKRIKDIADIYALSWYSDVGLASLKSSLKPIMPPEEIQKVIGTFTKEDLNAASNALDMEIVQVKRVLSELESG